MPSRLIAKTLCALLLGTVPALGHELWLSPHRAQVVPGSDISADIRNGELFQGVTFPYFPGQTVRFDTIVQGETHPYPGKAGSYPAFQMVADTPGLWVLVHQTTPSQITYAQWSDFEKFAVHKDFPNAREQHLARGLPAFGFSETYTRYVKALIGVGAAKGQDERTGLETEFVALTNPYTDDLTQGMTVGLLYQGGPRANAQVEVFERAPSGDVSISTLRTDAKGKVVVPVAPGHDYLLDAVVLRPANDNGSAVWETLWAALTFSTPAP